jgi:Flp pilus assembly protein TadD
LLGILGVKVMATAFRYGSKKLTLPVMLMTCAMAISACQNKSANLESGDDIKTGSTSPASFTKTSELGNRWNADRKNAELGLAYADGLEKLGQTDQQLGVLKTLSEQDAGNSKLQSIYGKKLLATGHPAESVSILQAATEKGSGDWRMYSALGSAYDQQGLYGKARDSYQKALSLQPNQVSVLNNMGMSHALEGDLKQAETILRSAAALPDSKSVPRVRQNLALVIGLQGRFEESRQMASEDLPPDQVEANLAYLQKMLAQPNTWQQLSNNAEG